MKILNDIQQKIKVPKQSNPNVTYKSRSAEDIVEMVKPLLGEAILKISDEIVMIGDRYYVKATATIKLGDESESATAYAREQDTPPKSKNGFDLMTVAQLSGSTSSYARKYALNGLFAIDDTQDDDTREHAPTGQIGTKKTTPQPLRQQISEAISKTSNLIDLEVLATKTKQSTKLSETEKESLLSEINNKAMDFEDVEITPETAPFNN